MAQQTINVGTAPNDGTGTPLRTAFQYTNSNFSELYTAVGPSGNNIVVPGNATITGDLTVRTNKLAVTSTGVGVGTASPGAGYALDVVGAARITAANGLVIDKAGAGFVDFLNSGNAGANVGTSGTGGLVVYTANGIGGAYSVRHTIAGDGIATWSNVGGVAGTAMTLNSTGLGVGGSPVNPLTVFAAASAKAPALLLTTAGSPTYGWDFSVDGAVNGNLFIRRLVAGTKTDVLEFDRATGTVGIGVAPSAWASYKALQVGSIGSLSSITGATIVGNNWFYDGVSKYITTAASTIYEQGAGTHAWYSAASGTAGTAVSFGAAKMTLDASGSLLVGTTNNVIWNTTNQGCVVSPVAIQASRSNDVALLLNRIGSDGKTAVFARQGLEVGDISVTTTGTTYNSTSDYRLKEAVQPISGGLSRVNALKPSVYKWKSNGSSGEGFLAHELAEVVPAAVSGEKDAVNEDGSIKAQSIDMSRVVPILVAAIQELAAEVNALKKA